MKIARVALAPVRHRLARPLVGGAGRLDERVGLHVRVYDAEGAVGRGEALPLPQAGTESPRAAAAALERAAAALEGARGAPQALLDRAARACGPAPAARCALDVALHELAALHRGVSVARALEPRPRARVATGLVIGAASDAGALDAARAAVARGYRTLKLKLATPDAAAVAALRRALGEGVRLRVDANGAWTRAAAADALDRLAPLGVELVEQPLAAGDLAGMRALAAKAPVPIAADETLATARGRSALLAGGLAHRAVLKPMVLGGLKPALELARSAAARGIGCYVTTTFDGPLATSAALHLAAALPALDLDHGLATGAWMADPFPDTLLPERGVLRVPEAPGLGI